MVEPTAVQEMSHAAQNPWLIPERLPHPIARHVRYVQAGTRIPIDVDGTARHTDISHSEQPLQAHEIIYQQPYHETEAIRHSDSNYQSRPTEVSYNSEMA